jgi:hypothetical protein
MVENRSPRARRWLVRSLAAAAVLLAAAQFVPVERVNPPVKLEILAPPEVKTVLERSCFDCHSNRTRWPWYAYVAPASWFVTHHVEDARGDLNFTEWPAMDFEAQLHDLDEMKEEIEEEEMPLPSYLLVHRSSRLSQQERSMLIAWIEEEMTSLSSLVAP